MIELTEKQKGYGLRFHQENNGHLHLYLGDLFIADPINPEGDTIAGLERTIDMTEQILNAYTKSDAFNAYASEWARDQGFEEPA